MSTRKKKEQCVQSLDSEDDASVVPSGDVAGPSSNINRRKSTSSSSGMPSDKRKKQQLLKVHGSAKTSAPKGGRGSAAIKDPGATGNGKAVVWYHRHWQAVDQTTYFGVVYESGDLRKRLHADNAMMQCLFCDFQRRYKPCTYFRTHLIQSCDNFKQSEEYNTLECQKVVAEAISKEVRCSTRPPQHTPRSICTYDRDSCAGSKAACHKDIQGR